MSNTGPAPAFNRIARSRPTLAITRVLTQPPPGRTRTVVALLVDCAGSSGNTSSPLGTSVVPGAGLVRTDTLIATAVVSPGRSGNDNVKTSLGAKALPCTTNGLGNGV